MSIKIVSPKNVPMANHRALLHPIQKIFELGWKKYQIDFKGSITPEQFKAAECISKCRTEAMGFNKEKCTNCGYIDIHYNSCGNRNCPIDQLINKEIWVDARQSELVDCSYFHVVFTEPCELNALIFANKALLYNLMHKSAGETLVQLMKNPKFLGAEPGIIQVLHTWGNNMMFHPHIHCIVSGGGIRKKTKRFIKGRNKHFCLPVSVLKALYKKKFTGYLEELYKEGKLIMPGDHSIETPEDWQAFKDSMYKKSWDVDIRETLCGKANAIKYLGRYVNRVAISEARIINFNREKVTFWAKDNKRGGKKVVLTVDLEEFIRRFLLHILPKGFQKIRYYGYLSNSQRKKNVARIQKQQKKQRYVSELSGMSKREILEHLYPDTFERCPKCGGLMECVDFKLRPLSLGG